MSVDPRWVTTPLGAALGLVVTRKLLQPKDRTLLNLSLGTAAGGGLGWLGGGLLKAQEPFTSRETGDKFTNWSRDYLRNPTTAEPTADELKAHYDAYGKKLPAGGAALEAAGHDFTEKQQAMAYATRVRLSDIAVRDATLPPEVRRMHEQALKGNQERYDQTIKRLSTIGDDWNYAVKFPYKALSDWARGDPVGYVGRSLWKAR